MTRAALPVVASLVLWLSPAAAAARVVQVPEGGRAVPVAKAGMVCSQVPAGWTLEPDKRSVRPPAPDAPGTRIGEVKMAADEAACAQATDVVTLVATGPMPDIDPASVVLFADDGRLEMKGQRLKGAQITWQAGARSGQDACLDPQPAGKQQQCVVPVATALPGDAGLRWLPANARQGADVTTFDANGGQVDPATFTLKATRVVLGTMFATAAAVDVSQGPGRVALAHPEGAVAVECGQARCELAEGAVIVRSVPALATAVTIRLRLAARTYFAHGDVQETVVIATLPILHCPLTLVSGPPLRDADEAQIVVRMDARCGKEPRLRWLINGDVAEVVRTAKSADATYVLLRTGHVLGEKLTVIAAKADIDATVVGSLSAATVPAPRPHVILELPKHGRIDFIPTNRDAVLSVNGAAERSRFVPLPVDGAYAVKASKDEKVSLIRGVENAGGFVSLRFGYRTSGLPAEFADTDLAIINERIQRAVREASVPAPFSTSAEGDQPLVELLCADVQGKPVHLAPGQEHRIPFEVRHTCRVIIHRERLRPEDGMQEVLLDIDVTKPEGAARGEAGLHERLILRPGGDMRIIPLHGGTEQFDHIVVRVSHVLDETRYTLSPLVRNALPSVQWSVTIAGGWARLYATVAIPAGLYRMNQPTGQLTLNFGVLSRLTTLNRQGKEGLLGLELGLMGMGLIQPPSSNPYPRTIGAVAGFGIRIPIGGGGAAVSVHIWGVYEFRSGYEYDADLTADQKRMMPVPKPERLTASRFALIFGPSISIGNAGTNL